MRFVLEGTRAFEKLPTSCLRLPVSMWGLFVEIPAEPKEGNSKNSGNTEQ